MFVYFSINSSVDETRLQIVSMCGVRTSACSAGYRAAAQHWLLILLLEIGTSVYHPIEMPRVECRIDFSYISRPYSRKQNGINRRLGSPRGVWCATGDRMANCEKCTLYRNAAPSPHKGLRTGSVPGSTDASDRFSDIRPEFDHRYPLMTTAAQNSEKSALRPPECFEIQLQILSNDSEPGACQDQPTSPISTMG